ncbi:MAG TPA: class I SAM-dependent methyltransferase [Candidatus Humimicrobiaceae bacterium]|nr:class I SAM-dependent methyltransferase [Candidatus Humimicrobiaceae bacterium]
MQWLNSNTEIKDLIAEKKLLRRLQKEAALKKIPIIDITAGRLLELVCILVRPKNILEIGCGTGFSTYFLVKNLKGGSYTGIDLNKERAGAAKKFLVNKFPQEKIRFLNGNALKIIPDLKSKFDLVFIDAAKYEYPLYIKAIEDKIKPGAIIIADNIFYGGKIFKKEISRHDSQSINGIKEYINYISNSRCFRSYFIDVGDGLSVTEFLKK